MMNGDAVKEVERMAKAAAAVVLENSAGRKHATTPLWTLDGPEKEPKTLHVSTLQGLVDYVRDESCVAYAASRGRFVHVLGPDHVELSTGIFGDDNQQVVLARADAVRPKIPFGSWQAPEAFNIGLMSMFADTPDRAKVLALTGNIKAEATVQTREDGVSQTVSATKGVTFKVNEPVPTIVALEPWRTFSEIQPQPRSSFILRIRPGGEGQLPSCALFEADGGTWVLDAIKSIKSWLKDELGDDCKVYG